MRRNEGVGIRRALEFEFEGVTGRGRREQVEKDRGVTETLRRVTDVNGDVEYLSFVKYKFSALMMITRGSDAEQHADSRFYIHS